MDAFTLIGPGSRMGYENCSKCGKRYFNPGSYTTRCNECRDPKGYAKDTRRLEANAKEVRRYWDGVAIGKYKGGYGDIIVEDIMKEFRDGKEEVKKSKALLKRALSMAPVACNICGGSSKPYVSRCEKCRGLYLRANDCCTANICGTCGGHSC